MKTQIDFIGIDHPFLAPVKNVKIYAKGNYDMFYIYHPDGFYKDGQRIAYVHHYHLSIGGKTLDGVTGWKQMVSFDKIPHIVQTLEVQEKRNNTKAMVREMDFEYQLA